MSNIRYISVLIIPFSIRTPKSLSEMNGCLEKAARCISDFIPASFLSKTDVDGKQL